jgi:hypothetical protein
VDPAEDCAVDGRGGEFSFVSTRSRDQSEGLRVALVSISDETGAGR